MDELEFSGKRYISSKRAAKENNYHSDYIGQLIRGGKIIGTKVGRAWYVEAESLSNFLGKEAPVVSAPIIVQNYQAPVTHTEPALQVSPLPLAPVTRIEEPIPQKAQVFEGPRTSFGGLTYIEDDEPLLPRISVPERKIDIHKVELIPQAPIHIPAKSNYQERRIEKKESRGESAGIGIFVVGLLGIIVFLGIVSISYFLKFETTVQEANVSSSIHF